MWNIIMLLWSPSEASVHRKIQTENICYTNVGPRQVCMLTEAATLKWKEIQASSSLRTKTQTQLQELNLKQTYSKTQSS